MSFYALQIFVLNVVDEPRDRLIESRDIIVAYLHCRYDVDRVPTIEKNYKDFTSNDIVRKKRMYIIHHSIHDVWKSISEIFSGSLSSMNESSQKL